MWAWILLKVTQIYSGWGFKCKVFSWIAMDKFTFFFFFKLTRDCWVAFMFLHHQSSPSHHNYAPFSQSLSFWKQNNAAYNRQRDVGSSNLLLNHPFLQVFYKPGSNIHKTVVQFPFQAVFRFHLAKWNKKCSGNQPGLHFLGADTQSCKALLTTATH